MKYCYHCFTPIEDSSNNICPNCGKEHSVHYAQSFELPAGTLLNNGRYIVGISIGSGGFGITYLGFDTKLKKKVVIKEAFYYGVFNRNCYAQDKANPLQVTYDDSVSLEALMSKTEKECLSLSEAESLSNIVKVYDWFSEHNTAYIITEYISGVTLSEDVTRNGCYTWGDLYASIRPLMISLSVLHKHHLLHRDIKPDNIMLKQTYNSTEEFVLIDFGLARSGNVHTITSSSVAFTPGYAPYEQRSSTYPDGMYTDVYALAATIYYALTGQTPVDTNSNVVSLKFPLLKQLEESGEVPTNVISALTYALDPSFETRCQTIDEFIKMIDSQLPVKNSYSSDDIKKYTPASPKEQSSDTSAVENQTVSSNSKSSQMNFTLQVISLIVVIIICIVEGVFLFTVIREYNEEMQEQYANVSVSSVTDIETDTATPDTAVGISSKND